MTNLSHFVCLDIESGTFFSASNAYIFDVQKLSNDELDQLINGTDDERSELAGQYGSCLEDLVPASAFHQD